jgi:glycosyltransferase involved in cell wall biosynthesis
VSGKRSTPKTGRLHLVANCVYGKHIGGGDTHFYQMARAAGRAGWRLHFFGGHALQFQLQQQALVAEQTLTDAAIMPPIRAETLGGQWRLLWDYLKRLVRTLNALNVIQPGDVAYAATDYWFDVWPVLLSGARRKMMILGMDAPTFGQIIRRSRPDVPPLRLNSIYYWASQNLSLRLFRFCRTKRLLYVHPSMKPRLLRIGYREEELAFVSNGMDLELADATPTQKKEYDVVWIGRFHRQKGIDDLLSTLSELCVSLPDFRAVLIGRLNEELAPHLMRLGLRDAVNFAGLVTDAEKFRLFKASRVMLMPSRYESWGIVIAEALACEVPVVAYDLAAYRPVFGDLVRYAPCFEAAKFQQLSLDVVRQSRAGESTLDHGTLNNFRQDSSWAAAGERFLKAVESLPDNSIFR